ncbi:hypothetical protein HZA42_02830 [Candidatus Peregrinibacteria bacterium]|nr:hypothetical protein [Candidatus Peregrinibacteria bacterium]
MNKHSFDVKTAALKLRSEGKTYNEIKQILGINLPKSTLSYWCKHVDLPTWYEDKVKQFNNQNITKAQKMAWYVHKRNREKFSDDLIRKNSHLNKKAKDTDVLKMLLAFLYLGEGGKWHSHRGLYLGSSDPLIIKIYMHLLSLCYGIKPLRFKVYICHRADQNLKDLQKYWSQLTSIPLKNFYPSKPDPRTIGKPTKRKDYKGVCTLTCSGTHIQLELESIPGLILKGL